MKISILGMGYVGVVSGACLAKQGHHVIGVDLNPTKLRLLSEGTSPIVEEGIAEMIKEVVDAGRLEATDDTRDAIERSDVSFVSVGTPSADNGSLSLTAIDAVTRQIGEALRDKKGEHTVVYRSTVLPGTTEDRVVPILEEASGRKVGDNLHVCFNPEFLREGSSIKDFYNPPMTVVGSATARGAEVVAELYSFLEAEFVQTSIRVAESVKYLCNIYHAVKIVFANEAGVVLRDCGIDARDALEIFCKDRILNVSPAYLRPGYAFGGSCLPKDTRAFLYLAKSLDIELPMLGNVLASNDDHVERAFRMIKSLDRRRIALFGLAFKGGTDDLRESPIVTLAERLIGRGYELKIYDVNVNVSRLIGANKAFIEKEIPHIDRLLKDSPAATLEDAEMIVLANIDKQAVADVVAANPGVPVVDLQGVAAFAEMPGLEYHGICW